MKRHTGATMSSLCDFRSTLFTCFSKRADALFELTDALITGGSQPSPVHLSLQPQHRRGWGSLYAALSHGQLDTKHLRTLLSGYPLMSNVRPVYAVDVSVWPRCDAEASPERGYYYHPSRHSAGQPIVAGWAYQWIAQLGFTRDSWTAPLDVRRVHPNEKAYLVAVEQIRALLRLSNDNRKNSSLLCTHSENVLSHVPLFVFDAGYEPSQLAEELAKSSTCASILVRLRSNRCFYSDPPTPAECGTGLGTPGGRPRRHGHKFECYNPDSWLPSNFEHNCQDPQYGHVRVRAWCGLHSKTQSHSTIGTRQARPISKGTLLLVEVSRLPRKTREPQVLWLWHWGQDAENPDLDLLWRSYVRRFDLEHTFRFFKQTLNWTTPRVRHPEQADRWSWLVLIAYTQLRLARTYVTDQRLPWERKLEPGQLTPYRVRRRFWALLQELGTPAKAPKPCGRSPGRPNGRLSGPAKRYPAIKKAA
ncbi:MAG: NF041680 family putative transposase [Chloroflexota bacterium]